MTKSQWVNLWEQFRWARSKWGAELAYQWVSIYHPYGANILSRLL